MSTWILLVMIHVGPMGSGNSNAITSVPGFVKKDDCIAAGKAALSLTEGTVKETRFVCVEQHK
jgi:hypothetical protein